MGFLLFEDFLLQYDVFGSHLNLIPSPPFLFPTSDFLSQIHVLSLTLSVSLFLYLCLCLLSAAGMCMDVGPLLEHTQPPRDLIAKEN